MQEQELNHKPSIERPWLRYYSKEAVESKLPSTTIYRYLWENNQDNLNRVALNYFGKKITYGEVFTNINQVALSLQELGIEVGDIVTIAMPSTPEAIYLFYALSKIGAVANMVDPRTSEEGLHSYIEETQSKLLFTIDQAAFKFEGIKEKAYMKEVFVISPADSMPLGIHLGYNAKVFFDTWKSKLPNRKQLNFASWKDFLKVGKNSSETVEEAEYQKEQAVAIVHTGGTTGVAKGVKLSNDNINIAAFDCIQAGFDFKREHNWLNIMPPFIAYGIGNGLHLPLICGMEVILIPQFNPNEFDKLLLKYRPNHMVGVPSHYGSLLESPRLKNADLSYIIAPTVGGDAMLTELEEKVNKFLAAHGCTYKIVKGYGMTEVNAAVVACVSNQCNELGSVGIPFPHSVVSIFDPDTGNELSYGEIGEIQIQTPNMMLGYYNNPLEEAKIKKVHEDGKVWIHSGDLGYMDKEGNLFIQGRMKNMIIRHDGFKIYPKVIEDVVALHPDVASCMVIGIDDLEHAQGKLPKVFVTLKAGVTNQNIEADLEILCKKKLAEYCQPVAYEVRNVLPLTPIGKLDYHTLELEEKASKIKNAEATRAKVLQKIK